MRLSSVNTPQSQVCEGSNHNMEAGHGPDVASELQVATLCTSIPGATAAGVIAIVVVATYQPALFCCCRAAPATPLSLSLSLSLTYPGACVAAVHGPNGAAGHEGSLNAGRGQGGEQTSRGSAGLALQGQACGQEGVGHGCLQLCHQ
jgi:hypothetical protein